MKIKDTLTSEQKTTRRKGNMADFQSWNGVKKKIIRNHIQIS